ncbi:MAG TPA: Rieske 2Fe-2S domain-containing protein [Alphaproteobacteria bacterium]|nr:Rieske 2Fe-2S domain-containing protein [Alphaproteobacteria bacterium]
MSTQTAPPANATVDPKVLERVKGWRGYVEAKLGFRNHWYPTLFSRDVVEGDVRPLRLLGENLLLKRIDGKVYAMKDRCLHRGVNFSARPECFRKDTITCWYHGWTYSWLTGEVVAILTNPMSTQIGKHKIKTYPVEEAKGIVFVFVGDIAPPPLSTDVPPNFLDPDMAIRGKVRQVNANWRLGVENGFDSGHIWIHKKSPLVTGNDLALPVGFAPPEGVETFRTVEESDGRSGVYDLLGDLSMPVFESYLGDEKVAEGHYGARKVADNISIWLPGVLKVDPWPQEDTIQFEWYVSRDAGSHYYLQTLGRRVDGPEAEEAFDKEFRERLSSLALDGFNDDDVWAREAGEAFYAGDVGWVEERLYEPDLAIVEWRKLASRRNRGIQKPEHTI